jgi:hypothetical protein
MSYGKIYDTTWWGNPVKDGWGDVYYDLQTDEAFKITVDTTQAGSASDTFVLPLASGETYNFDIAWGDGTSETITSGSDVTHVYSTGGTYQISITGTFPRIYFNNSGDKAKLMSIDNFGTYAQGSTSQERAFNGCSNMTITATDSGNFGSVTNFIRSWADCSSLTSFPLIDTSNATSLFATWIRCSSLTTFPLIDTSSCINISFAWNGCSSLTSFPLLDTSSGTTFSYSWNGCSSLTSFPLIDTSSGTDFSFAWIGCSSLTTFPLIDTSSGTTFLNSWNGCSSLSNFPANAFDTNIATNYSNAFNTTNLTTQSIDDILVSLDTSGVSNGTFTQSGGQAPSATGESAIDSLVGKGWTITVTGGYTP